VTADSKTAKIEDVYVSREFWHFLQEDASFQINVPFVSTQSFVRLMFKGFEHPSLGLDIGTFDILSHISKVQTKMDLRLLRLSHKKKVEKMLGWKESPIGQVEIKPTGAGQGHERESHCLGFGATTWLSNGQSTNWTTC
jgi:hypothetical protein